MKKNGFTLAEVLITLAIIGVVATLTLPALMNNTQEQQFKTALKKGLNTLTTIAETNNALENWDFTGVATASDVSNTEASGHTSLYAMMATRGSVDYALSGPGTMPASGSTGTSGNFAVFFRDGSVLMFPADTLGNDKADEAKKQSDGLAYGIRAVFDVNGKKLPNLLSNCSGETAMSSEDPTSDAGKTCDKANRVIKDRFGIRLRERYAVPNGAAARWAYEN